MYNINEVFNYIKQANIESEFTKSLEEGFEEHGQLTEKQEECLHAIAEKHKYISALFGELDEHNQIEEGTFTRSLKVQFEARGYLSKKQLECLKLTHNNYFQCINFFKEHEEQVDENTFLKSLRDQFNERGFLTPKQMRFLIVKN